MDYVSPLSMMLPGGIYGHGINPQAMQIYQQGMRPGRRNVPNLPIMAPRSPLLDEFRENKTRRWELKAGIIFSLSISTCLMTSKGNFWLCCRVQWGSTWLSVHSAKI
jgi:hypothetical protein